MLCLVCVLGGVWVGVAVGCRWACVPSSRYIPMFAHLTFCISQWLVGLTTLQAFVAIQLPGYTGPINNGTDTMVTTLPPPPLPSCAASVLSRSRSAIQYVYLGNCALLWRHHHIFLLGTGSYPQLGEITAEMVFDMRLEQAAGVAAPTANASYVATHVANHAHPLPL